MSIQGYIDSKIYKRNLGIYFRNGRWLFHVFLFGFAILYYYINYFADSSLEKQYSYALKLSIALIIPFLFFFYSFCIVLIPLFFKRNKTRTFWLLLLSLLLLFPLIDFGLYKTITNLIQIQKGIVLREVGLLKTYLNFITAFIGFTAMLYFMELLEEISSSKESWSNKKAIEALELDRIKTQMHPDFMIKSLTGITELANEKSDLAPEAVIDFSDVLRYRLYRSKAKLINLDVELSELQKLVRLHNSIPQQEATAELEIDGNIEEYMIVPLSLLNIAECALATFRPSNDWSVHMYLLIEEKEIQIAIEISGVDEQIMEGQISMLRKELEYLLYSDLNFTAENQDASYSLRLCIPIFKK